MPNVPRAAVPSADWLFSVPVVVVPPCTTPPPAACSDGNNASSVVRKRGTVSYPAPPARVVALVAASIESSNASTLFLTPQEDGVGLVLLSRRVRCSAINALITAPRVASACVTRTPSFASLEATPNTADPTPLSTAFANPGAGYPSSPPAGIEPPRGEAPPNVISVPLAATVAARI